MYTNVRVERPVLNFNNVAVCLHIIEKNTANKTSGYNDISSMELDLLSYAFQEKPPLWSTREPQGQYSLNGPLSLEIIFPSHLDYYSEGRTTKLECEQQVKPARVLLSSTSFQQSGYKIWHLVLTPEINETFNEFDIIKLIHLYDGRSENTNMSKDKICFRMQDGREFNDVRALLRMICPSETPIKSLKLKSGTIEITTGSQKKLGKDHAELISTIINARQHDGGVYYNKFLEWINADSSEKKAIMAYCGVVTGIFDFDKIGEEEILDTLEPTFADLSTFYRVHRCTLICINKADRSMEECWDRLGISPYLIIPHAVLLHNEMLVDDAAKSINEALSDKKIKILDLEKAYSKADADLNSHYLPNIFNYITERSIYEKGGANRGYVDKAISIQSKLKELKDRIDMEWQIRRDQCQMWITILVATLSFLSIKTVIFELPILKPIMAGNQWKLLSLFILFIWEIIICLWRRGIKTY